MAGRFSVPNHRLFQIFGGLLRLQAPLTYLSAPLTTGHKQDMEQGWMPCWTDHFLHRATPLPDPMLQGQAFLPLDLHAGIRAIPLAVHGQSL